MLITLPNNYHVYSDDCSTFTLAKLTNRTITDPDTGIKSKVPTYTDHSYGYREPYHAIADFYLTKQPHKKKVTLTQLEFIAEMKQIRADIQTMLKKGWGLQSL